MEKKCTACKGTRLRKVSGLVCSAYADLKGETFVCLDCGHIEIYSSELLLKAQEAEEKEQRVQALYDELDEELRQKKAQMEESESNILELRNTIKELEKKGC